MNIKLLFVGLFASVVTCSATVISSSPLLEPFSVRATLLKPGPQFRGPNIAVPSKQPLPEFPLRMRLAKFTDEVVVSFTIEADGGMTDIKILKHSQKEFDAAVLDALKQWRFTPTKEGAKTVRTTFEYVIRFAMHDE